MKEFLADLTLLQQIFFIIAASSTIILVIQTILALIGIGDNDGDADADFSGGDVDADVDVDVDIDADVGEGIGSIADAMHAPHHADSDFDVQGLRLFTIRGIVAFFAIGSWVGFILNKSGVGGGLSCLGAVMAGSATLYLMAKLMQLLMRLQEDGTMKVRNALGQVGQVYIRIPASEKGMGKVNVTVQEQLREFDAVTENSEMIPTGEMVYVTDIRAGNVLVVEKVKK